MFDPKQAFNNFFVILASLWPLFLAWFAVVAFSGMLLFAKEGCEHFFDKQYLAFSTALSLGSPQLDNFAGAWRVLELVLDFMGIILWGIFTSITMKAIEGAYE